MLVIRMQRTGRKGHAQFRVVVQDSRRTPTSGKIVAHLGHFDPHSKQTVIDKEKASFYLEHGAQPSDRAARLLKAEGVKLPSWVRLSSEKQRSVRNADKRRSTRPPEPQAPAPEAEGASAEEASEAQPMTEQSPDVEVPAAEEPAAPTETAPVNAEPAAEPLAQAEPNTSVEAESSSEESPASEPTSETAESADEQS